MSAEKQFAQLDFQPFQGCSSPHIQTVFARFSPPGKSPPSQPFLVPLTDGDLLSCQLSTPPTWNPTEKTILLVHGLCGNHESSYMVRLSRKIYNMGYRAVRINLRCCGSGYGLARRPYHGGISDDLLQVAQALNRQTPRSPTILIGFSLGGNIAVKLAGELGSQAEGLLSRTIAVCAPLDLAHTAHLLTLPHNRFYQSYYLHKLQKDAQLWLNKREINTMVEFDSLVTAPQWGFKDAADYYEKSSSRKLLQQIRHPCTLLYAQDDPFIDYRQCTDTTLSPHVQVFFTRHGGHMGFFGWADPENRYFWLDSQLLKWVKHG